MKVKLQILILLLLSSCAPTDFANMQFQKQYNSSLEGMRVKRQLANMAYESSQANASQQNPSASSSPSSIAPGNPVQPTSQLPEDMFDITYDTKPYPPFINIGGDFDAIKIPTADSYNVKTEVSDKPYLLVDASSIQGSVDKIKSERTDKDIANSEVLIAEIKKITREEKMLHVKENKEVKNKKIKKQKVKDQTKTKIGEEVVVYDNPNKDDSSDKKSASSDPKKP